MFRKPILIVSIYSQPFLLWRCLHSFPTVVLSVALLLVCMNLSPLLVVSWVISDSNFKIFLQYFNILKMTNQQNFGKMNLKPGLVPSWNFEKLYLLHHLCFFDLQILPFQSMRNKKFRNKTPNQYDAIPCYNR